MRKESLNSKQDLKSNIIIHCWETVNNIYPLVCSRLYHMGLEKTPWQHHKGNCFLLPKERTSLRVSTEHVTRQLFVTIYHAEVQLLRWTVAEQKYPGATPCLFLHLQRLHTVSSGRVLSWMLLPTTMNIHSHWRAYLKTWMCCQCFVNITHLCRSQTHPQQDERILWSLRVSNGLQPLLLQKLQT